MLPASLDEFLPSVQVHRLHQIGQLWDDTIRLVIWPEGIEKEFEKLCLVAVGDKEKNSICLGPQSSHGDLGSCGR